MTGSGKAFVERKSYVDILLSCMLNAQSTLNLMFEEERLQHFSFPEYLLVMESKTVKW